MTLGLTHRSSSAQAQLDLSWSFWPQIGLSAPLRPHRTISTAPGAAHCCTDFELKCVDPRAFPLGVAA